MQLAMVVGFLVLHFDVDVCLYRIVFICSVGCGGCAQVHLLAACHRRNIPVLCSGGAGGKADPSKVRVGDLAESVADPLCRAVRTQLRKNHNITRGIPVLMSTEKQRRVSLHSPPRNPPKSFRACMRWMCQGVSRCMYHDSVVYV